jgi:hypothetical protein
MAVITHANIKWWHGGTKQPQSQHATVTTDQWKGPPTEALNNSMVAQVSTPLSLPTSGRAHPRLVSQRVCRAVHFVADKPPPPTPALLLLRPLRAPVSGVAQASASTCRFPFFFFPFLPTRAPPAMPEGREGTSWVEAAPPIFCLGSESAGRSLLREVPSVRRCDVAVAAYLRQCEWGGRVHSQLLVDRHAVRTGPWQYPSHVWHRSLLV